MTKNRLNKLDQEIKNFKWDIIGLSEVIRKYDYYIFYFKGEKKGMYGVGLFVKKVHECKVHRRV